MFAASIKDYNQIIRQLLNHEADIDVKKEEFKTSLQAVSFQGVNGDGAESFRVNLWVKWSLFIKSEALVSDMP